MENNFLDKKAQPVKKLITILKKHSGRDNKGRISVRHQGGRQKRYYRIIDFKRDKTNMEGEVLRVEKDPNRNCFIALIKYKDGELRYIIHPNGLKVGDTIVSSEKTEVKVGNSMLLKNIPLGIMVHNLEVYPGKGAQFLRSAGSAGIVFAQEERYTQIKLPSGEIRRFLNNCRATVGQVGNIEKKDEKIGKAGRKILMGIKPTVRGTAQNPRSHPHGGGEGRSGEGMHPKTPWGKQARGKKTRNKFKNTNYLIVKRRK